MRGKIRKRTGRWRALAVSLVAALGLGGMATLAPTQAAAAAVSCQVTYSTTWDSGSGFGASAVIKNTGTTAWTAWTLTYAYSGTQTLQSGWNGTWTQSGKNVTVASLSWNGAVAAGGTVNPAANFGYSGTNTAPTVFAVNGTVCGGAHTPPAVSLTSPTAGASYTAPATVPMAATATTSDGATVSKIEFYSGTTLVCTATASPFTCNWTGVAAGSYSITAEAYDSLGATATSAPAGITVSSTPSVTVAPTTLSVAQGSTGTLAVKLSSAPTANVTVATTRTSGNTGLSVTAGASLTFTPSNWSTAQNVTITADASGTGAATFTSAATGYTSGTATVTETGALGTYEQRFMTQYNKIMNPANGYFSPLGIPYHSVETLIIEAPDYGHETTSEAWSYYIWITAMYGNLTKDWTKFNTAWSLMEQYMIPTHADQPTNSFYTPSKVASYAPEHALPEQYPSQIDTSVPVGADPIAAELQSAYGTQDIYGMHWLEDVDNKYGYGDTPGGGCEAGPNTGKPSYINSYQRGPQEGVFETIPQPTCDNFTYGGPNGYLDLFIKDSSYAKQWKYTDAPDADARAIQAAYWADTWAKAQGNGSAVATTVAKAGKMGDYLRYSFFDKYFKQIGNCTSPTACPGVTSGRGAEHYLLSWYYAWGGSNATSGGWAWRIGDSAAHQGYQNPMAAYALITDATMKPLSTTGVTDWTTSLQRQLEFYTWLQSNEGAIAGGATNSWGGAYGTPPAGDSTFYGMYYDPAPVFADPPSNQWFGFQAWSLERLAEYYYTTNNAMAKKVLDKWVTWALSQTTLGTGTYQFPSTLNWSGQPDTWNAASPGANASLHVTVVDYTNDVGVAAAYAKLLSYYAAKSGNTQAKTTAQAILDDMWNSDQDSIGVSLPETRKDYNRVTQVYSTSNVDHDGVYVPSGWTGKMPNGDTINSSSTFLSIRSWYTQDPQWSKVQTYLNGGAAPVFNYHRFWAQTDIAMAQAVYGQLFGV